MKNIILGVLMLLVVTGCSDQKISEIQENIKDELRTKCNIEILEVLDNREGLQGSDLVQYNIYVIRIKEHQYIVMSKGYTDSASLGITHDPECPCGKNETRE